jgi:hypothetical protein
MGIAFELAVASHRDAIPGRGDLLRAALAHNIIALAKVGERDPERLCEAALKAARSADPLLKTPSSAELPEGGPTT